MKQAYTKYNPLLKKTCKEYNLKYRQYLDILTNHIIDKKVEYNPEDWNRLMRTVCELCFLEGHCVHIYIKNKEFYQWIVSCYKDILDENAIREIPTKNIIEENELIGKIALQVFCLHFPSDTEMNSFLCAIDLKKAHHNPNKLVNYLMGFMRGPEGFCFACALDKKINKEVPEIVKFIGGLAQYINCFPETVKQGVPEDLKHPSQHKSENPITIGVAESVRPSRGEHASPCGHFRRGHFKTLSSDFYKKKRGQTIFVRETFVKGEAVTVLDPDSEELKD